MHGRAADRRRRGDPLRRRDQLAAAAAALRRRQRRPSSRRSASTVVHDLPGVGEHLQDHLEVYIQHACKQPVSMQPDLMKWRNRPWIGLQVAVLPHGPGRHATTSRRGGFVAQQRRRRLPEPDVPLPADRDPLRRLRARGRPRLPGARRPDVLRRARLGEDHVDATRACKPALRFNYLSTEQDRREWVEADPHGARTILTQPAFEPFNGGRDLARAVGRRPTRRSSTGCARDAETALHPSCTCRMGVDDDAVLDPLTMRVHGVDGLRVVDASVDAATSPTATSTRR